MLQHLTENLGKERLMLYPEGFRVRIFPLPGKEPGSPENGLAYGQKWPVLLAKYDQDSVSWKTHHYSLLGDLERFSETWPSWGMMQGGVSWELMTPERRTEESGYGYWPTPAKRDYKGSNSREHCEVNGTGRKHMDQLPNAVVHGGTSTRRTWLTPKTPTGGGQMERKTSGGGLRKLEDQISQEHGQNTGQLNPPWVEWLIGWPIGWTDLKPLEMDRFRRRWLSHFQYFQKD
jgi:hypothetical protein